MKIQIGHENQTYGELEAVNGKLKITGQKDKILGLISGYNTRGMSAEEFLTYLLHALRGYTWARRI